MNIDWVMQVIHSAAQSSGERGTWLAAVEGLLRGSRERRVAYLQAAREDHGMIYALREDVLREARTVVQAFPSVQVPAEAVEPMEALFQEHADRWIKNVDAGQAVVAWAAAQAIDEVHHSRFIARLRSAGEQVLEKDRAYLVHRYDPRIPHRLVEGPVNTNPDILLAMVVDRTTHVRLAGEEVWSQRFVVDWDSYDRMTALSTVRRMRIAVCQPNLVLEEFDVDWLNGDGAPLFRNHGPRDVETQKRVILRQLNQAIAAGAHIILFPEYAIPSAVWEGVEERLSKAGTAALDDPGGHVPVLTVGGIGHERDGSEPWRNEARLGMARGTAYVKKCHSAYVEGHREDIGTTAREVRVFMTERFAVTVPICRDAMEPSILRQLEDLGANLCLVPSMTPKTSTLVQRVCGLAAGSQAIVAFVNTPADWNGSGADPRTRVVAAFHGPYETHPSPVLRPEVTERPLRTRAVWLFDLYDRTVSELTTADSSCSQ